MRIKMIEDGSIAEVEDSWGERLIEHGKAVPAGPKKAKAEVTATDKVPDAEEGEKPESAKKTGKKR